MIFLYKMHHALLPQDHDLGVAPYLNLLFLAFFFLYFYYVPPQGINIFLIAVGMTCFLVCYFRAYWFSGNRLIFYIVAILAIGILMSEISLGGSTFFIYAAAFACGFGSKNKSFLVLVAIMAVVIAYAFLTGKPIYYWIPAVFMSVMIGTLNIHQTEVMNKNKALKQSQTEIQTLARTAERERISRDLHDLLGHTLSVITLKSELAGKMIDKGVALDKIRKEVKAVEQLSRETLAQVRDAVKNYNKATIQGELLQARVATEAANIELVDDIQLQLLSERVESELALIIREAITNVIRHANTKSVWVKLFKQDNDIFLEISDEGCETEFNRNSGMQNMKSRIEKIHGKMTITYKPNTCLIFSLPLAEAQ